MTAEEQRYYRGVIHDLVTENKKEVDQLQSELTTRRSQNARYRDLMQKAVFAKNANDAATLDFIVDEMCGELNGCRDEDCAHEGRA